MFIVSMQVPVCYRDPAGKCFLVSMLVCCLTRVSMPIPGTVLAVAVVYDSAFHRG
jgi:hypothetical protein